MSVTIHSDSDDYKDIEDGKDAKLFIRNQKLSSNKFILKTEEEISKIQLQKQSTHYNEYINYFQSVQELAQNHIRDCLKHQTSKINHRIFFLPQKFVSEKSKTSQKPFIHILKLEYNSALVTYEMIVSNFKLIILMFNVKSQNTSSEYFLGAGGFGEIYEIFYKANKNIVSKRILFQFQKQIFNKKEDGIDWMMNPNNYQLEKILEEYAIYKICSFFKIGPLISTELGFDILCFNNSAEFFMEKCTSVQTKEIDKLTQRMKTVLRVLHKLKIIHKDIKPENILFSKNYQNYVLIDFGLSFSVYERVGELTKTFQQGTPRYMCPEMYKFGKQKQKYIDLYFNDLWGLRATLVDFSYFRHNIRETVQHRKQQIPEKINEYYFFIYCLGTILNNKYHQIEQQIISFRQYNIVQHSISNYNKNQITNIIIKCLKDIVNMHKNTLVNRQKSMLVKLLSIFNLRADMQMIEVEFLLRIYKYDTILLSILQNLKKKKSTDFITKVITKIKLKIRNKLNVVDTIKEFRQLNYRHRIETVLENELKYLQEITWNQHQVIFILDIIINLLNISITNIRFLEKNKNLIRKLKVYDKDKIYNHEAYIYESLTIIISNNRVQYKQIEGLINTLPLIAVNNRQAILRSSISILLNYMIEQDFLLLLKITQNIETIRLIAMHYFQNRQTLKAIQYIQKYLQQKKDLLSTNNQLAICCYHEAASIYIGNGDFDKALNEFSKSLKLITQSQLDIKLGEYYNGIGLCYLNQLKFTDALSQFEKALYYQKLHVGIHSSTLSSVHFNIGLIYYKLDKIRQAIKQFKIALLLKPLIGTEFKEESLQIFNFMGKSYLRLQKYGTTLKLCNKMLEILVLELSNDIVLKRNLTNVKTYLQKISSDLIENTNKQRLKITYIKKYVPKLLLMKYFLWKVENFIQSEIIRKVKDQIFREIYKIELSFKKSNKVIREYLRSVFKCVDITSFKQRSEYQQLCYYLYNKFSKVQFLIGYIIKIQTKKSNLNKQMFQNDQQMKQLYKRMSSLLNNKAQILQQSLTKISLMKRIKYLNRKYFQFEEIKKLGDPQ